MVGSAKAVMAPYWSNDEHGLTIYHGDCVEVMPQLEQRFDLCLTDPPYGIPVGSAMVRHDTKAIEDWRDAVENVVVGGWLPMVAFADAAYCVEFGRSEPDAITERNTRHAECGLTPWHLLVIAKAAPTPTPRPTFASSYETALVSYAGVRRWYGGGYVPNRWYGQMPNQLTSTDAHPTQKPLAPFVSWMSALSPENALVIDPFIGSGTTLVACYRLGRRGVGIEISEEYCELAAKRLETEIAQRRLFEPAEIHAKPKQLSTELEAIATTAEAATTIVQDGES